MMTEPQQPVMATEPIAPWLGGKRHLAKRICSILALTDHDSYVEPFVGMGGVFLRRRRRPRLEVINDISGDVATLFRVLRAHPDALFRELRWRPAMRAEFDRARRTVGEDLTDIERAARFLYLQTLAYGGKVHGRSFGVNPVQPYAFDLNRLAPRIAELHRRLAGVIVENLDWADLLPRYDRPGALFYLDPPYWQCEGDYGPGVFARADFQRLARALEGLKGKMLMSINDAPEIREMFGWAEIMPVATRYSIGAADRGAPMRELLIGKGVDLAAAETQRALL